MPQESQASVWEPPHLARLTGDAAEAQTENAPIMMMDRSSPAWAKSLSWFFAIGSTFCILSICILSIFFLDLAAMDREPAMAPLLVCVGLIPIVGLLIFEFSHIKALAGYRIFRQQNRTAAQAFLAVGVFLLLEFIHPLLGLSILLGAILCLGSTLLCKQIGRNETMWDFLPQESVSILTGRDETGRVLAGQHSQRHGFLRILMLASVWVSLIVSFGLSSWLAAQDIVSSTAIPALALITFWAVSAIEQFLTQRNQQNLWVAGLAASVKRLQFAEKITAEINTGKITVEGLTIAAPGYAPILSDIQFDMRPGQVIGLQGEAGSGKSLLLRSLISPHDLTGLNVRGQVRVGDTDLWDRSHDQRFVPAVFLPPRPLMLPSSGADNLSCFKGGAALERGKRILEQFVFASDSVEKICATADATRLSDSEQKSLAFARGFLLSPALYLLDRPEDGISEKAFDALVARIAQECQAGRSFVIATENRGLLDLCDQLLVLRNGRLVDFGQADEIRARQSSGWRRFVAMRSLDTEENLETWVRSHFRREGDDLNRRKACIVAAELLAFSCQNELFGERQPITFEFKHYDGYCLIKMMDQDTAVSSGTLIRAEQEVNEHDGKTRLSPLAVVFKECAALETYMDDGQRVLLAKLATYDPRKFGGQPPKIHQEKNQTAGAETYVEHP